MNRLRNSLLVAPVFFVVVCAGVALADAPQTQDWFRGGNPPLPPPVNGGGDFTPPGPGSMPGAMGRPNRPMAGGPNGNVSDFPDDSVHDWVVANARTAYSRAMFHRAERELDDAVRMAQFTFERSRDYVEAQAEEKRAYDAYTAERANALKSVLTDPKYLAAIRLRDETGQQIARVRARTKGEVPRDLVLAMASLKLQYASDAHAIEVAALDKADGLKDARRKMVDASSKVTALRASFDASVRTNSQILQARRNLEDARVGLITAEAYLNAASIAGAVATDYSYYRHRWDGIAAPQYGNFWGPYGY